MKPLTVFWRDLKQRGVVTAIVIYAVVGFVILLLSDFLAFFLAFPVWLHRLLIETALAGLPVTAVVAWNFDLRRHFHPIGGRDLDAIHEEERVRTTSVYKMAGFVTVLLAIIMLGGAFLSSRRAAPDIAIDRIAIAGFENRTDDRSLDPLGNVAADWTTQRLIQSRQFDVVPFTSMVAYRAQVPESPSALLFSRAIDLARGVGAGLVVWGAYYIQGDSLRFNAQITDTRSGDLVRDIAPVAVSARQPLAGIARLRESIAFAIAQHAHARLGLWANSFAQPPALPAYDRYLEGIRQYVERDYDAAAAIFSDAHSLDTSFIAARVWQSRALADAGRFLAADSVANLTEKYRPRLTTYERALLDHARAQSHHNSEDQYTAAGLMLMAAPSSDDAARLLAIDALAMDHPREARSTLLALNQNHGWINSWDGYYSNLALSYDLVGDYADELRVARQGLASFPRSAEVWLAQCRALAGLHRIESSRMQPLFSRFVYRHDMTPGSAYFYCGQEMASHGHRFTARAYMGQAYAWFHTHADTTVPRAARADYASLLVVLGRRDSAYSAMQKIAAESMPVDEQALMRAKLAFIAAVTGHRDVTQKIEAELDTLPDSLNTPYILLERARIAAVRGQLDRAWSFLGSALQDGLPYASASAVLPTADYALFPLHRNPGFRALYRPRG